MMMMELEQLKTLWMEQDKKLDKSLQLNMQLLRQVNFDKATRKVNTIFIFKIIEMISFLAIESYLADFIIQYSPNSVFSISALITMIFLGSGIISDIRQMTVILQLRADGAEPVSYMQKKVEKLKLRIIGYVKWSLIAIPFYPVFIITAGQIFMKIDFWAPQHRSYLLANIAIGALLLPGFVWLYRQFGKQNPEPVWVKNFLIGSGWNQAVSAQQFLTDIEKFENGE